MRVGLGLSFALALALATGLGRDRSAAQESPELFRYDAADTTVAPEALGSNLYDAHLVADGDGTWLTWLEFTPGEGDRLWVGRRREGEWLVRERVTSEPGRYARPTLTLDTGGGLWLSYERQDESGWDVLARRRIGAGEYDEALPVSGGRGNDIAHRVAADPRGGLWFVWQSESGGQFDVLARLVGSGEDRDGTAFLLSSAPGGDWCPAVAVTPRGDVGVVWDRHDGHDFDVVARVRAAGDRETWGPETVVAGGPAFEGRARITADRRGRFWVLWEQGAEAWGREYRGNDKLWNNVTDARGPVHRLRRLHVARLDEHGVRALTAPLPMPALERASARENRRKGVRDLGLYYERGIPVVDGKDRLWVVYRHYQATQVGQPEAVVHHVEQGWRVYARHLDGDRWSRLWAFEEHQRDGMQRLSAAGTAAGLAAVWSVGRTDRRRDPHPRGLVLGHVEAPGGEPSEPALQAHSTAGATPTRRASKTRAVLAPAVVGDTSWSVFFGDLHRHTDLSLCFPFYDGSLDDAYRYAIEVAGLDFLGITDHTRDIDRGDVQSLLWWRSVKEVTRHRLEGRFVPYFAFERSHRDTDHNVVSLRDDMLRNFPPPLPEYWAEIDGDTLTIPHRPFIGEVWEHHDDLKRPLLEIYQGFRDEASVDDAHAGLARGHHLGFIASSDHLSTSASLACVWAATLPAAPHGGPAAEREAIFRGLQARRTYAATARIRLVFRAGEHWMGERTTSTSVPDFRVEVDGTGPLERVVLVRDGAPLESVEDLAHSYLHHTFAGGGDVAEGEHYYYVHVVQRDGNQAWSSPIWVAPPE